MIYAKDGFSAVGSLFLDSLLRIFHGRQQGLCGLDGNARDLILPIVRAAFMDRVALVIYRYRNRHILHRKGIDRFHAQILECHHRAALMARETR